MPSLLERFERKYEPITETGCWIWTAATQELGYGVLGLGTRQQGTEKAHRISYRLFRGDPAGSNVLHRCGIACCVNPDHLYLGTLKDNAQDTIRMGRQRFPDNRGERATWSKLKYENVNEIRSKKGVVSASKLAQQFNVSRGAIYNIWLGLSWKSLST